jgi:hypothetical protein
MFFPGEMDIIQIDTSNQRFWPVPSPRNSSHVFQNAVKSRRNLPEGDPLDGGLRRAWTELDFEPDRGRTDPQ